MRRGSRVLNKKENITGTIKKYANYKIVVEYDDNLLVPDENVDDIIEIDDIDENTSAFDVGKKVYDPVFGVGKIMEKNELVVEDKPVEGEYMYKIEFVKDGSKKAFTIPLFKGVNYIVL